MNANTSHQENNLFVSSGERLAHILDQICFKHGRGRINDFHAYLIGKLPEVFGDLKYTTVRSWFHESAPPMKKVDAIIGTLQEDYPFLYDISQIKTWWKVGGYYPFSDGYKLGSSDSISDRKSHQINEQKLQFIVMSLVMEETGSSFNELTGEQLVQIKDKAVKLAKDFVDPFQTECPDEYMRMAIRDEIGSIIGRHS